MMTQLVQETEVLAFEPGKLNEKAGRGFLGRFHARLAHQLGMVNPNTPEQARIQQLESQNQRLVLEVETWKKATLNFAHELRDLRKAF